MPASLLTVVQTTPQIEPLPVYRRDPETSSIRSSAPSYVSEVLFPNLTNLPKQITNFCFLGANLLFHHSRLNGASIDDDHHHSTHWSTTSKLRPRFPPHSRLRQEWPLPSQLQHQPMVISLLFSASTTLPQCRSSPDKPGHDRRTGSHDHTSKPNDLPSSLPISH